ncbi:MAG TPA: MarR family winged helix-turn-helix transcriptional regulator [Pseudonocardia sp.]|nr:MarR family winged helix-turn-helix transcriptional regulator [Pseudonocardia sp.]
MSISSDKWGTGGQLGQRYPVGTQAASKDGVGQRDGSRPFGINSPQFSLLVVSSRLGPVSRAEIGRQNQERSTLTRNLQLILAQGWAEEVPHTAGGHGGPIALTEAGRELPRTAAPGWRAAQDRAKLFLGAVGAGAVLDIADVLASSTADPVPR